MNDFDAAFIIKTEDNIETEDKLTEEENKKLLSMLDSSKGISECSLFDSDWTDEVAIGYFREMSDDEYCNMTGLLDEILAGAKRKKANGIYRRKKMKFYLENLGA